MKISNCHQPLRSVSWEAPCGDGARGYEGGDVEHRGERLTSFDGDPEFDRAEMRLAITVNNTQYQYSVRAAQPENVAYFEEQVLIASPPMTSPLGGAYGTGTVAPVSRCHRRRCA